MLPRSPWPLVSSFNAFRLLFSFLIFLKYSDFSMAEYNVINIIVGSFVWWVAYRAEFNLEGKESLTIENGLKYSIILFISSEVFFFFSFFWSYFHYYRSPIMEIGLCWPPYAVQSFDFLNVPIINTLLLLSSGVRVTISHYYLIHNSQFWRCLALGVTIVLGLLFTVLQGAEYSSSFFSIRDSSFGTSFFMLTGFHGIHVIIGTIFLATVLYRILKAGPSKIEYLRFELASWYWHFVDVVWIFLFFLTYYLNS